MRPIASIDGALTTTPTFAPLGFGATLRGDQWRGTCSMYPTPGAGGGGKGFPIIRYGTRHRSAMNFAGACPGSIAFVISQDGPIRAFARANDRHLLLARLHGANVGNRPFRHDGASGACSLHLKNIIDQVDVKASEIPSSRRRAFTCTDCFEADSL
jgi:hypothetical protein